MRGISWFFLYRLEDNFLHLFSKNLMYTHKISFCFLPVYYLERDTMEFVKVKISDILPAEYNPRKELKPDDEEFIKISNSIDEFGYSEPIIVNKDMTIIGGHQRLNVLKYKGIEEIEVVKLDLPKNKEKALNKLYNDFYDLADEYIKELYQYKCFLNEGYLNRVEINLKPTMEHFITKILNKE